MTHSLQVLGLLVLALLAALLLSLIAWTFYLLGTHISTDGRVPSAEAFGLTALLLSFREVIGSIRTIYDTADRSNLTDKLAASTLTTDTPQPVTVTNTPANPVQTEEAR